jgi:autotransporter-associated beta strand protein
VPRAQQWTLAGVQARAVCLAVCVAWGIAVLGTIRPAAALDVGGYSAAVNDRFTSGFPTAPVPNTSGSFVGLAYDWSGVGWSSTDGTKGFGFLSPRHYLVASHYGGATNVRLATGSGLVTGTQQSVTNTGYGLTLDSTPDLSVGRLTAPLAVTAAIARYGVLDLYTTSSADVPSAYASQPVLVYGRGVSGTTSPRVASSSVFSASTTLYESPNNGYMITKTTNYALQVGDSGSPAFIPWTNPNGGSELTIIGNNAAVDTTNGNNLQNFIARTAIMSQLNTLMTPDGYALRMVGNVSGTWVGSSSTNITNRGSWGLSAPASAPSDVYVLFNGATAGNGRAVNVNAATNLRGLSFKATGTTGDGFTFSGANTLTIGRGGLTNYDADRQTISAPIALGDHQYWDVGSGGVTAGAIATGGKLLEIAGSGTAVIAGVVSGSGGLALSGSRLELTGSSTYTGATWVHAGTLVVNGHAAASSGVTVDASATLGGSGVVAAIGGAGTVAPGNSPGILTAPSVDGSGGLDFAFEFTGTGSPAYGTGTASVNDVLRLTGTAPFTQVLTPASAIDVFFNVPSLTANTVFRGGFFTDRDAAFLGSIQNAAFRYYASDSSGTTAYNGATYSLYSGPFTFEVATVAETAGFSGGAESGYVTQFTVVPEPAAVLLAVTAGGGLAAARALRRRRARARQRCAAAATLLAVLSAGLAMPRTASAVIIDTLTGTGNTTAPADDPGWANVGVLGVGTGVYLGNDWVLTAAHVGGGSIVLNGGTYAMLAGSGTRLTNGGEPGKTTLTDLYMFQLASTPVGLAGVPIAAAATVTGAAVTMIGSGRDRGAFTQWSVNTGTSPWVWTEVTSGGNAAGYKTLSTRTMRWGTNTISAADVWLDAGYGDAKMLATTFTDSGVYSSEAQAAYGDSGGGVFHKNGSSWELSGMILTVAGYSGQPDPGANAVYGNVTYAADLSFYRPQIMAIVPEPQPIVLAVTAVGGLLIARSLRRRPAAESPTRP